MSKLVNWGDVWDNVATNVFTHMAMKMLPNLLANLQGATMPYGMASQLTPVQLQQLLQHIEPGLRQNDIVQPTSPGGGGTGVVGTNGNNNTNGGGGGGGTGDPGALTEILTSLGLRDNNDYSIAP